MEWVVATAKAKKRDDTNGRITSGYDIHMYPQWVSNPLQGLNRHVLIVRAILGHHSQFRALNWCHFSSYKFTRSAKITLEK